MKLFIALTPAVLIGCALVETWASILSKKQPSPPAVSAAHPSKPRPVPVFTFGEASAPVATVPALSAPWAVAQAQVEHSSEP